MRGDRYGLYLVARTAAELIARVHARQPSIDALWVEALGNPEWDDLVSNSADVIDHWQAKDQVTPLSEPAVSTVLRSAYSLHETAQANGQARHFTFGLRSLVQVAQPGKVPLELLHLQELCKQARQPGMDAQAFVTSKTRVYDKWWPFIKAATGTQNAAHLHTFVRCFFVEELGDDTRLRNEGAGHLRPFFSDPEALFDSLVAFFFKYPDGRVKVTYRVLMEEVLLSAVPAPGAAAWAEFRLNDVGTRWELRGTLPIPALTHRTWASTDALELGFASEPAKDQVTAQLTRLALHRASNTRVSADQLAAWSHQLGEACCGTLGHAHDSFPTTLYQSSPTTRLIPPIASLEAATLATLLRSQMDALVWAELAASMQRALRGTHIETCLLADMQSVWTTWHAAFDGNADLRHNFMSGMVATAAERRRNRFDPLARLGTKSIASLTQGTIMALALCSAFKVGGVTVEPLQTQAFFNMAIGAFPAHLITTELATDIRTGELTGISRHPFVCLSTENTTILLARVVQEASVVYRFWRLDSAKFSQAEDGAQPFDKLGPPFPMVTASDSFFRALEEGVAALRKHLCEVLRLITDEQFESLANAVHEATGHD